MEELYNGQNSEEKKKARKPRVTKDILETALQGYRKTNSYPWTVISDLDAARLEFPANPFFRYEQRFRLYSNVTKAAINAADQIRRIIQCLPASYQLEIMNSAEYTRLDKKLLELMMLKEQKSDQYDSTAFHRYSQMLFNGIRGVMSTMNPEFNSVLLHQLAPFLNTMQAISAFERSVRPHVKSPPFTIPEDLRERIQSQGPYTS